jgi:hypothetical protein
MTLFIFKRNKVQGFNYEHPTSIGIFGVIAEDVDKAWLLLSRDRQVKVKSARKRFEVVGEHTVSESEVIFRF